MSVPVCRAGRTRNSSLVVAEPWPTDRRSLLVWFRITARRRAEVITSSDAPLAEAIPVAITTEHRFSPLSANMCRSRDHKTGAEWDLALSLNGDAPHAQIAHSCCTVDNPLAVGSAGR